jgi:hypothetical protein
VPPESLGGAKAASRNIIKYYNYKYISVSGMKKRGYMKTTAASQSSYTSKAPVQTSVQAITPLLFI